MIYELRAKIDENLNILGTDWHELDEVDEYQNDNFLPIFDKSSIIKYAKKSIAKANSTNSTNSYLCIFDLDNFKLVNDTYGHMFGDEVLLTVCDVVKKVVSGRGVMGRIGGDEMMIVFDNVLSYAEIRLVLRAIREGVEAIYKGKLGNISVTTTIGICTYPENATNYDDCFKIADAMLYRGKEKGKNRYIIYEPEIHGDILKANMPEEIKSNEKVMTNKEALVLMLLQKHLHEKRYTFLNVLQMISDTFDLDELSVVENNNTAPLRFERQKCGFPRNCDFAKADDFARHFEENNLVVINSFKYAEQYSDAVKQYMIEQEIRSMLVYRMETYPGYIYFIRKSDKARGWDKRDVTMLNILGKVLEISLNNR